MAYPRDTTTKSKFPHTETREVQRLTECMSICRACAKKCIEEDHKRLALLCLDCSEVCDLAIKLKCCDSEYTHQVLDLCCQICRNCASECDHIDTNECQECAEVCRRCAEACSSVPSYQ